MSTFTFKMRLLIVALMISVMSWANVSVAANATTAEATSQMVMGSADAPVTLHEYVSLTCPHCATFYNQVLPTLKKEFVDTGKVRIVYHDFPHNEAALTAAMLARCTGPKRFFGVMSMMMSSQAQWYRAPDPVAALMPTLRFAGVTEDDARACLSNGELRTFIMDATQNASMEEEITSVPSFILNGNKFGAVTVEDFRDVLSKAVAEATK